MCAGTASSAEDPLQVSGRKIYFLAFEPACQTKIVNMRAENTKDPIFRGKTMKRSLALAIAALAILASYAGSVICGNPKPSDTRPPAVAGQFYPADPQKLKLAIQQYLQDSVEIPMEKPLALIVPHAGYIYSGQICADAYRQVVGRSYDVVVLLGVNHTTGNFSGISLGDYGSFRTPLGDSLVDEEITSALLAECTDCNRNREVHAREHSIEVQLPFVQTLFPNARIVPAIIHPPDSKMCMRFGEALGKVLNGRRALIVISSDLSHYPTNTNAEKADSLTLTTIAALDPSRVISVMRVLDLPNLETRACGEAAILAGMTAAKALGATRAVVAGYANSGDVLVGRHRAHRRVRSGHSNSGEGSEQYGRLESRRRAFTGNAAAEIRKENSARIRAGIHPPVSDDANGPAGAESSGTSGFPARRICYTQKGRAASGLHRAHPGRYGAWQNGGIDGFAGGIRRPEICTCRNQ